MSERSSGYYARVMGTFWRHPRTSGLSLAARGMWVSLVSWSADQRSDGEVPVHAVNMACGGRSDTKSLHELERAGLVEMDGERVVLRDWAQHNITREKHEKEKERARNGMANKRARSPVVTRNKSVSDGQPSDQDQDQDQEHSRSSEREIHARAPEAREPSVTERAERARHTIAAAYRSRGLAVPRGASTLAVSSDVAATLAGLPIDALEGILERFFGDASMRAKGYPLAYLMANPNQWAIDGISRDDGSPRERPAETVIPDWMRGGAA